MPSGYFLRFSRRLSGTRFSGRGFSDRRFSNRRFSNRRSLPIQAHKNSIQLLDLKRLDGHPCNFLGQVAQVVVCRDDMHRHLRQFRRPFQRPEDFGSRQSRQVDVQQHRCRSVPACTVQPLLAGQRHDGAVSPSAGEIPQDGRKILIIFHNQQHAVARRNLFTVVGNHLLLHGKSCRVDHRQIGRWGRQRERGWPHRHCCADYREPQGKHTPFAQLAG